MPTSRRRSRSSDADVGPGQGTPRDSSRGVLSLQVATFRAPSSCRQSVSRHDAPMSLVALQPRGSRAYHAFAVFTCLWALMVVSIGGLVTSKGVGMAVPDWPTTYGYNMFFFPIRMWEGGIFHEHLHRLVASGLGLLTLILAVWTTVVRGRSDLQSLVWTAAGLVIVQGVLGGKRVLLNSVDVLGIPGSVFFGVLHATTAQVFLGLLAVIAFLAHPDRVSAPAKPVTAPVSTRRGAWVAVLAGLTLLQLMIAATMRHQHAGLAIPDFPLAYQRIYPRTDPVFLESVNQKRVGVVDDAPVTAFQIHLQMIHRMMGVLLVTGAVTLLASCRKEPRVWRRILGAWVALYGVQFCLGAATIWTNKAADIATLHVAVGAVTLAAGAVVAVWRLSVERQSRRTFQPCSPTDALLKSPTESGIYRNA